MDNTLQSPSKYTKTFKIRHDRILNNKIESIIYFFTITCNQLHCTTSHLWNVAQYYKHFIKQTRENKKIHIYFLICKNVK